MTASEPAVAIVDYGMGNLRSVESACHQAGLRPFVTSSPDAVLAADGVILPGVGAFGDAMQTLVSTGLATAIRESVAAGREVLGICLGLQLLASRSHEYGEHEGLGIIGGDVLPLPPSRLGAPIAKVPHVGWNTIQPSAHGAGREWSGSLLDGLQPGCYMYFVHSYYVELDDTSVVVSVTDHGETAFCSSFTHGSVFGCQFHPERSGRDGLWVYQNLADRLRGSCSGSAQDIAVD